MNATRARWSVYIVLALVCFFTVVFILEFVVSSEPDTVRELSPEGYAAEAERLLQIGNAENGNLLIDRLEIGCGACHRVGVVNNVAPSFVGLPDRAADRNPPLTAPAYIYQSIIHPMAYVVEGYTPAMPHHYAARLSEQDMADILVFLLSPDAH